MKAIIRFTGGVTAEVKNIKGYSTLDELREDLSLALVGSGAFSMSNLAINRNHVMYIEVSE